MKRPAWTFHETKVVAEKPFATLQGKAAAVARFGKARFSPGDAWKREVVRLFLEFIPFETTFGELCDAAQAFLRDLDGGGTMLIGEGLNPDPALLERMRDVRARREADVLVHEIIDECFDERASRIRKAG